jgi:hypothetical protein
MKTLGIVSHEAQVADERVLRLAPEDLPAQGLINRLAN